MGDALAKDLNIMHVTKHMLESFKNRELDIKKSIIQTAEKEYAAAFDKEIAQLAEKNDCVITTWLGPWLVKDATIMVWLSASPNERARRHAMVYNKSLEEAKAFIKEKDELTVKAFKEIYSIDVLNHSFFDMMINTEKISLSESVSLISMLAIGKEKSRFR